MFSIQELQSKMKEPLGLNYSGGLNFAFIYSLPAGPYIVKEIIMFFFHKILACKFRQLYRGTTTALGGGRGTPYNLSKQQGLRGWLFNSISCKAFFPSGMTQSHRNPQ